MQPRIFLASQSPRRKDLLCQAGLSPIVLKPLPSIDSEALEAAIKGEKPRDYVLRVAGLKLQEGIKALGLSKDKLHPDADDLIIAADTTVDLDGEIFAKPKDAAHAKQMLLALSGRTHQVHTAVWCARINGATPMSCVVSADVRFAQLTDKWIEDYVASKEPLDKAGAYAIQGQAAAMIPTISGSYTAIVGLPLFETLELIHKSLLIRSA